MGRLYDRSFKLGFIFTILTFVLLNVGSYLIARNEYQSRLVEVKEVHFSGFPEMPNWGIPFSWYGNKYGVLEDGVLGLIFNFCVIVACAFFAGLLCKFVSLKQRIHAE